MTRFLTLGIAAAGFVLFTGSLTEVAAQCKNDPFCTPAWKQAQKPKTATPGVKKDGKPLPPAVAPVVAPAIEARINYYKQAREQAAAAGQPIPKVTSVLTLDEMAITGIFKTSRGYAAMVEATPIKLSYTIYPGEKFFDGQLVAIEDNRLVFRKVVKMSNNKFVTSVENKTLRQYTVRQEIEGTAPTEAKPTAPGSTETAATKEQTPTTTAPQTAGLSPEVKPATPGPIVSPLDEMNKQPESKPEDADKGKKNAKKPTKVAKKQ